MCRKATYFVPVIVLALATSAWAQNSPAWRKIGGNALELSLASPAGGPVTQVWYSPEGALFARAQSGKVFQTTDFDSWTAAANPPDAPAPTAENAVRLPESNAKVFALANARTQIFAVGRNLSRSEDGGRSWTNLTSHHGASVIGAPPLSVAISPTDSNRIAVANEFGVWRTADGGMTWTGANLSLPNLTPRRILSTVTGAAGTRIQIDGIGAMELPPGGSAWMPTSQLELLKEASLQERYRAALGGAVVRSAVSTGSMVYAGTADGRIFTSFDSGATFGELPQQTSGPVERIFMDPQQPSMALAAIGGGVGPHVLRTVNFGRNWDPLDSASLPNVPAHGITADRVAGAIYVATDKGVFYGRTDLLMATLSTVAWQNLTADMPAGATDVKLDPAGVQLYIGIEGYGVYAAAAPHNRRTLKFVDVADSVVRPAAPGSLVRVIGAQVSSASAGGSNYPVLLQTAAESQIQVPFDAVGPNVSLALRTAGGPVSAPLPVQPVSPAILLGGDGAAVLVDADTQLPLDMRNAAHSNGRVLVMATGLGRVRPDWPAGVPVPLNNPPAVVAQVHATLDGAPLQVTSATLAGGFIGLYVVELQLPSMTNAGVAQLSIEAGGVESNKVQIWIEP